MVWVALVNDLIVFGTVSSSGRQKAASRSFCASSLHAAILVQNSAAEIAILPSPSLSYWPSSLCIHALFPHLYHIKQKVFSSLSPIVSLLPLSTERYWVSLVLTPTSDHNILHPLIRFSNNHLCASCLTFPTRMSLPVKIGEAFLFHFSNFPLKSSLWWYLQKTWLQLDHWWAESTSYAKTVLQFPCRLSSLLIHLVFLILKIIYSIFKQQLVFILWLYSLPQRDHAPQLEF